MSRTVYLVQHVHATGEQEDVKVVGIYSSEDAATAAVQRLSNQPGFKQNVDGFSIDTYLLDKDHWTEGFVTSK